MIVKLLTEHHLEFLSLKGGCRGSSESTHFKMPHCWKSHAMAHLLYDWREYCLLICPICFHIARCLPEKWSNLAYRPRGYKTGVQSQTQNKAQ